MPVWNVMASDLLTGAEIYGTAELCVWTMDYRTRPGRRHARCDDRRARRHRVVDGPRFCRHAVACAKRGRSRVAGADLPRTSSPVEVVGEAASGTEGGVL